MRFGDSIDKKPFGEPRDAADGDYFRTFKEGPTLVRFLHTFGPGWTGYFEHYDKPNQRSVPCNRTSDGDTSDCPACNSDDKNLRYAGRKVVTNLLLVDKDIILPFKMSQRLYEQIERKAERDGNDPTKRDYLITRTGKSTDTVYDVDREDSYEVKNMEARAKDEGADHQQILNEQYESYYEKFGGGSLPPKDVEPKGQSAEEDIPPTEPADLVIDEASLRAMNEDEIDKIISAAGLKDVDPDWSRSKKVDVLVDRLGE
jgi:hypothetical protein